MYRNSMLIYIYIYIYINKMSFWMTDKNKNDGILLKIRRFMVGVRGFEPPASWSRTKHSTKLSHTPKHFTWRVYHTKCDLSRVLTQKNKLFFDISTDTDRHLPRLSLGKLNRQRDTSVHIGHRRYARTSMNIAARQGNGCHTRSGKTALNGRCVGSASNARFCLRWNAVGGGKWADLFI